MKKFATIIIILAFTAVSLQAQFRKPEKDTVRYRDRYGAFIHMSINSHIGDFVDLPGIETCCPSFNNASGLGPSFGLLYEHPLNNSLFVGGRLGLFNGDGVFKKTEYLSFGGENEEILGKIEHKLDVSLYSLGIEPMIGVKFADEMIFHAGLQMTFFDLVKDYSFSESIVEPYYGTFENGSRRRLVSEGELRDVNSLRFALIAGLSYEFPMDEKFEWIIAPELFFKWGLSDIVKDRDWKLNTLNIGFAVKYSPKKDTVPEPIVEKIPEATIGGDVFAFGVDKDGNEYEFAELRVEEYLESNIHPLLNYVFFDENSTRIPYRYNKITPAKALEVKKMESLYGKTPIETYYNLLNIVGKRMKENPDATITLVGCNSNEGVEKNNLVLSKNRALNVKEYFVRVWNIDSDRIEVESRNLPDNPSNRADEDGIIENRRVEILTDDFEIIAPITKLDTLRKTTPQIIRFKHEYKGDETLDVWRLIVSEGENIVKVYDGASLPPVAIDWDVFQSGENLPDKDRILQYQTTYYGKTKIFKTAVKEIPVNVVTLSEKKINVERDSIVNRFTLVLFSFDDTKTSQDKTDVNLSDYNEKTAEQIRFFITDKSRVEVIGHTDRMGEENYNLALSEKRAEKIADALGADNITHYGKGETELIYDNDKPEGRFYSRRVEVVVKTPIPK